MVTAWLSWIWDGQGKSSKEVRFELSSERQEGASHAKIRIGVNSSGKRNINKGPEVGTGVSFWKGRKDVSVSRTWWSRARVAWDEVRKIGSGSSHRALKAILRLLAFIPHGMGSHLCVLSRSTRCFNFTEGRKSFISKSAPKSTSLAQPLKHFGNLLCVKKLNMHGVFYYNFWKKQIA